MIRYHLKESLFLQTNKHDFDVYLQIVFVGLLSYEVREIF
jgi:hypothetical protein